MRLSAAWIFASVCLAGCQGASEVQGHLIGGERAPLEEHRVMIHNVAGGDIVGSKDQGATWIHLGKVVSPIQGGIWLPTKPPHGVLAFNFLRGSSNVFASAVNAIHLRFSDPVGYQLPQDLEAELVVPHGVSVLPFETLNGLDSESTTRVAVTDMPGGTGFFGPEWSPRVGSKVEMGDGIEFKPIPYEYGPDSQIVERSFIRVTTYRTEKPVEYYEFENVKEGKVLIKYRGEAPQQIAKVKLAVEGIGRFKGSEFIQKPGHLRANHPGVICFGTTDLNTDPSLPHPLPTEEAEINPLRGGFQIVPSHHWQDSSMNSGTDHPFVYMVVGPIIDPPDLKRYDRGVEGTYPLFKGGMHGGAGRTSFQFESEPGVWYEINDAIALGKFRQRDGTVVKHLRGVIRDALVEVTRFRYEPLEIGRPAGSN